MKKITILTALLIFTIMAQAQNEKKLKFNKNGEFKIVQFTDTHIDLENNKNLSVYKTVKKIIEIEKPDFVILTGDIITEKNAKEGYQRFSDIFRKANIPWAIVFGNHDSQGDISRKDLSDFIEKLPYCMNKDVGDKVYGNTNFVLSVYGKSNKTEALLYCIDTGNRSALKIMGNGYDWIRFSQIDWYRKTSQAYTLENGGKALPALAFFHIPLLEYNNVWNNNVNPPIGVKNEDPSSPKVNSGMFTAMLEKGDVMGTFVGHDHINDYIGVYYNIALAHGRVTKIMKNPDEDPLAGGRVIVLKEGEHQFETWIRDMNGKRELYCNWPNSFRSQNEGQ